MTSKYNLICRRFSKIESRGIGSFLKLHLKLTKKAKNHKGEFSKGRKLIGPKIWPKMGVPPVPAPVFSAIMSH